MNKKVFYITEIIALFLALSMMSCNGLGIHGSGIIKDEQRDVTSFESVEVSGFYDIEIKCGEKSGLRIIGDDNIIPLIKTEVRNKTLHIWNKKSISPRRKLRIEISTEGLKNISCSGASRIYTTNINTYDFKINVSGACNLKLIGKTSILRVNLSGASNINAEELKAAKAIVDLSGASNATVYASEELHADISGIGTVNYFGNPQIIRKSISGLGSINQK